MGVALINMTELIDHEVPCGAKEVDIGGFWREVLQNDSKGNDLRDVSVLTNDMQKLSLFPSLSLPLSYGFK